MLADSASRGTKRSRSPSADLPAAKSPCITPPAAATPAPVLPAASAVGEASSTPTGGPSDALLCAHGPLVLRIAGNGKNAGRAYYSCRLPRNDRRRCEHAFIWMSNTAAGRAVCHAQTDVSGSAGSSASESALGSRSSGTVPRAPLVSAGAALVVRNVPGDVCGQVPVNGGAFVGASTARGRFLAANAAANMRRPVQQRDYEVRKAVGSLRRMTKSDGHGGSAADSESARDSA